MTTDQSEEIQRRASAILDVAMTRRRLFGVAAAGAAAAFLAACGANTQATSAPASSAAAAATPSAPATAVASVAASPVATSSPTAAATASAASSATAAATASAAPSSPAASAAQTDGFLRIVGTQVITNLAPRTSLGPDGVIIRRNVFHTLLPADPGTGEISPLLSPQLPTKE